MRELADRCTYPPGMLRQFDAVLGTGSLLGYSKAITAPTVVLHGSADPMVRPRNGRAVAAAIPGARFVVVDGMGHDLPEPVWRPIIETLCENFAAPGVKPCSRWRPASPGYAALTIATVLVSGLTRIGT